MKLKDYNSQKKSRCEAEKTNQPIVESQLAQKNIEENSNDQSTDYLPPQPRQKKHRTTKEETEILSELKVYKDKLPDDAIASVCEHLSEVWTKKKVREWWNYHKDK